MEMFLPLFFTIIFFLISSSQAHTMGTVTVDKTTFDKILHTFDVVLVKFDVKYPKTPQQQEFKKFAEKASSTKKFIIIEVPIADLGDRENQDLAEIYRIKKEDYPVYKLFLKDKSQPIDYTGDKSGVDLIRFVTERTNLWFGSPGTLEELDFLARDFFDVSTNKDQSGQQTLLAKAREQAKTLVEKKDKKNAGFYLKIMEAIAEKDLEFLKHEESRIQKILDSKITFEKRLELLYRKNIILSFKSAKESIKYTLDDPKAKMFDPPQHMKIPVFDRTDL